MNRNELQMILGYLNIGLAIAHNQGVTVGHFGSGDFIGLAETVNSLLLRAVTPPQAIASPVSVAPVASLAPVALAASEALVAPAATAAAVVAPAIAVPVSAVAGR